MNLQSSNLQSFRAALRYTQTVHGEYKSPGGKLVVADVEVAGGRLEQVNISGDFFLEPDSALEDINAALIGMSADAGVGQLAQAITGALGGEVSLIGFTPEAVGVAVRRALGRASGWDDFTFDLIGPVTLDPVMHMALDEIIPQEVAAGQRPPTLRFWEWDAPLVIIGAFQSVRNEVDIAGAERRGIRVARRVSGGGAMFMEPGGSITYSLAVPASLVEGLSFEQSYAFLDDWVLGALAELGVAARYAPLNDIASEKGKIAGAAQKRFASGVVLHHVTMAYDMDAGKMAEVLRVGREKLSGKGAPSANKRVDPLRAQTKMARKDVMAALLESFRWRYATRESRYTEAELAAARALVEAKFLTPEWTFRIP